MRLLLYFLTFAVTVNAWGSPASYLHDKCHAYSGLSHFDEKAQTCYILDISEKHSKDTVSHKICKHIQGFNGKLASKNVVEILKDEGLVVGKRQTFFDDGIVNEIDSDGGAAVCQYTDHFSCPSGQTHYGTFCHEFHFSPATYEAAEQACTQDHGTLAVPHDDSHAQHLASLAKAEGADDFFYVGIRSLQGSQSFENSDKTPSDYFRFLPRKDGFLADSGSRIKGLEVAAIAISSKPTNDEGLGTFGYMEVFEGKSVSLPFVCQFPAKHAYGKVVVPYSTLAA